MIASIISKSKICARFHACKRRHPLLVNMSSAAIAWSLGDALCQYTENFVRKEKTPFDWKRNMVVALYATMVMTPVANVWYEGRLNGGIALLERLPFLRSRLQVLRSTHNWKLPLLQSGLTFTFIAPIFGTSYIFTNELLLGNGDPIREWKRKIVHLLSCDICFWVTADFLNFYFISIHYRVLFMLFADVLWSFILSALNNNFTEVETFVHILAQDQNRNFLDDLDEGKTISLKQLQTFIWNFEKMYPRWVTEYGPCNPSEVFANVSKDSNVITLRSLLKFLRTESDPNYMTLKLALTECGKVGSVQMFDSACNSQLSSQEIKKYRRSQVKAEESVGDAFRQAIDTGTSNSMPGNEFRAFREIAKTIQP